MPVEAQIAVSQARAEAPLDEASGTPKRQTPAPARQPKSHEYGLRLDAQTELAVLSAIKQSMAEHHEALDDPEIMLILAEGETSLFSLMDRLLEFDLVDDALAAALKQCRDTLSARLHRIEERRRSRRTIIEQALLLLECKSLERPTATITLSDRAPQLVVEEEAQIPAKFFDLKPVLNRRLTKEALLAGEEVPGARLSSGCLTLTMRRR